MTVARSVADVLDDHVVFEVESIDRMYLNVWQPRLAYGGGVQGFFVAHRGYHYASTALMDPMTNGDRQVSGASGLPGSRSAISRPLPTPVGEAVGVVAGVSSGRRLPRRRPCRAPVPGPGYDAPRRGW
jgi:hypothetical protein